LQQNAGLYRIAPLVYGDQVVHLMNDMPTAYDLYSAGGHVSALVLQRYYNLQHGAAISCRVVELDGRQVHACGKGSNLPGYVRVFDGKQLEICENASVLPRPSSFTARRSCLRSKQRWNACWTTISTRVAPSSWKRNPP